MALIAILLATILTIESIIMFYIVSRIETVRRSFLETEVIKAITLLENIRDEIINKAIDYSFYQAMYYVGARGGYVSLEGVRNLNCLPYWKIYSDTADAPFPDIYPESIRSLTEVFFNAYSSDLETGRIETPQYEVLIESVGGSTKITGTSEDKIQANKNFWILIP